MLHLLCIFECQGMRLALFQQVFCGRSKIFITVTIEGVCYHGNTKHPLPLLTMATQSIGYHYLPWQHKASITITYRDSTKHPLPLLNMATQTIHYHYLSWQHKPSITLTYRGNTKHQLPLLTMAAQTIHYHYLPWQHKPSITITYHGNTKHPVTMTTDKYFTLVTNCTLLY